MSIVKPCFFEEIKLRGCKIGEIALESGYALEYYFVGVGNDDFNGGGAGFGADWWRDDKN